MGLDPVGFDQVGLGPVRLGPVGLGLVDLDPVGFGPVGLGPVGFGLVDPSHRVSRRLRQFKRVMPVHNRPSKIGDEYCCSCRSSATLFNDF